jgi:hypothetical protein
VLSRGVRDLHGRQDIDDRGHCRHQLSGSTMMGWIDQMILIIGRTKRFTSLLWWSPQ